LPVPAQQCGGGDREDLTPAVAWDQPRKCGEPDPVGRLVPDPGDLAAQYRVLVSQRQHFCIPAAWLRSTAAGIAIRFRTSAVMIDSDIRRSSRGSRARFARSGKRAGHSRESYFRAGQERGAFAV
jgi:hypothetical protein